MTGSLRHVPDPPPPVVVIVPVFIQIAQSGDLFPCIRLIPDAEPLGNDFFTFAPEHATDKWVAPEESCNCHPEIPVLLK